MREAAFHRWLMSARKNQKASADAQVRCAKSCESRFNMDLDAAAVGDSISGMIEQTKLRTDLSRKTRDNHTNALRRYAEFANGAN